MLTFADVIKGQILARKKTKSARKLLEVIDGPKTKRRQRILNRLEQHAKLHLEDQGYKNAVQIEDWSTVEEKDWATFFDNLLKFLMAILPMILPLFV